jgi:hypothetical protein
MIRVLLLAVELLLIIGSVLPVELSAQNGVVVGIGNAPIGRFSREVKEFASRNKEYVAEVFPDLNVTKVGKVAWQGNIGRTTWLWSIKGTFSTAWLSNDGDHFVAGYEGGNLLPQNYNKNQVMLTFFNRDKIINRIRLNQLIADLSKLEKVGLNYRWARFSVLNADGYLVLETVEGRSFIFDLTTGQPSPLNSENKHGTPAWNTYQDPVRCYGFRYPHGYLLEQDKNNEGEPTGSIFLKREENNRLSIEGDIEDMADYPRKFSAKSFEEFVYDRTRAMHSADGPDGSTYAAGMVQKRRFINPHNLDVLEFYVSVVHETYSEDDKQKVEKEIDGPMYAVSIGAPGEPYRVFFLSFGRFSTQDEAPLQGKEILKQIVDTVRRDIVLPRVGE